jgi:hypothetical protein
MLHTPSGRGIIHLVYAVSSSLRDRMIRLHRPARTVVGEWSIPGADSHGQCLVRYRKAISTATNQLLEIHLRYSAAGLQLSSTRNGPHSICGRLIALYQAPPLTCLASVLGCFRHTEFGGRRKVADAGS